MFLSPQLEFALESVRRASLLVRGVQQRLVDATLTKGDKSPVTVADFAAQALVSHTLLTKLPGEVLVGEEDAADLRDPERRAVLEQVTRFVAEEIPSATPDSVCEWIDRGAAAPGDRFWTLDPIDGTKGFLRGEQYAVALALIVEGRVELGVLGCPNLTDACRVDPGGPGSLVLALAGQGTWTRPLTGGEFVRINVSQQSDPALARLLRSVESGHTNADQIGEVAQVLQVTAEPVRMDSQAKYAVLAAGGGELMLRLISPSQPNYREKIWDQAAGSLVIEEAGGRVTDLDGKPLDFSQGRTLAHNRGVVASNGRLHEAALVALRQVGA